MKLATKEMLKLIKQIGDVDIYGSDCDFSLDEDTRWHEVPIDQIWEAGQKNLPLWRYGDHCVNCLIGTEEEVLKRLEENLEKAKKKHDEDEKKRVKLEAAVASALQKKKLKEFEKLKKELNK